MKRSVFTLYTLRSGLDRMVAVWGLGSAGSGRGGFPGSHGGGLGGELRHAADAAVLADLVDGYEGNYSLVHDCIGCSPGRQRQELIERFQKSFERVTTFDYLNGILDENKITRRLNQPPAFGTFKPDMSRGSNYMVC